jgi:hypothetical protein
MDFTVNSFKKLLNALQSQGFSFQTFAEYSAERIRNTPLDEGLINPQSEICIPKLIILRHDVDARPENSLVFARIQATKGIKGTYYFRMVPQSYNEAIIKEMVAMGHEVGYHYETMDTCKGDVDKAYDEFCCNLEIFRKLTPVKTISMHGSPMSPYDNREIWKKYDYRKLGIIAEPYFDINFNELYYITDTGRCWDGSRYNVRDKATKENPVTNPAFLRLRYHATRDIIHAVSDGSFPGQAMLNFHPQRWNDALIPWMKEFVWQNVKNQGKRILLSIRK